MKIDIIYGPPGTGKTSEIVRRIKDAPDNFLFCSFTKAAAKEGLKRLGGTSNKARTIHSVAFEHGNVNKAQIVDSKKLKEFSKIIGYPMSCLNPDDNEIQFGDELMALVNLAGCKMLEIHELYKEIRPEISLAILENFNDAYQSWKNKWGFIDFNDMIYRFLSMPSPDIDALFVDEAQDLSPLQWAAIKHIKTDYICIAGDDDQAIYSWGGANPHGMIEYAEEHKGEVSVLEQSHRLPRCIWQLSEKIVSRVKERHHKAYLPMDREGEINKFGSINGLRPQDLETLVLYRNHSVRWIVEEWLINHKIPYKCTGPKGFFDNWHANNIKKYLKLQAEPDIMKYEQGISSLKSCMYNANLSFDQYRKIPWQKAVKIPMDQYNYLRDMDLTQDPKHLLSTIHSAKGMEAEQVILLTAQGNKTWENMSIDPDAEHRVWYVGCTRSKRILNIIQGGLDYQL